MNILLWVLQVALALLCLAGGAYKVFKFDELASTGLERRDGVAGGLRGLRAACAQAAGLTLASTVL
jgi:hypothetical protein